MRLSRRCIHWKHIGKTHDCELKRVHCNPVKCKKFQIVKDAFIERVRFC